MTIHCNYQNQAEFHGVSSLAGTDETTLYYADYSRIKLPYSFVITDIISEGDPLLVNIQDELGFTLVDSVDYVTVLNRVAFVQVCLKDGTYRDFRNAKVFSVDEY